MVSPQGGDRGQGGLLLVSVSHELHGEQDKRKPVLGAGIPRAHAKFQAALAPEPLWSPLGILGPQGLINGTPL